MNSEELRQKYEKICDTVADKLEVGLSHEDQADIYEWGFDELSGLIESIIGSVEKSPQDQFTGWVAVLFKDSEEYGEARWCIAPQDFWDEHHYVPDDCIEFKVPGFFESAEHTLRPLDNLSIEEQCEALGKLGFKVLKGARWYFELEK